MDHLNRQSGGAGPLRDRVQLLLAAGPQDHLRLTVAEPGPEVSGAESCEHGGYSSMRGLRRYLAPPHAKIGTHHERQLGLHD